MAWLAHLLLLSSAVRAFTPTFTPASQTSQCGAFTVTWSDNSTSSDATVGPPFNLSLIPINPAAAQYDLYTGFGSDPLSQPFFITIPDSAWDRTTKKGSYTLSNLPFRTGERYIVVMDDGFGLGTGGVSGPQVVGNGAGTPSDSCLKPLQGQANISFALSSLEPAQCGSLTIRSGPAKAIRGFVPGGSPFSLDLQQPDATNGTITTVWEVNIHAGTYFVLLYEGKNGEFASTGLIASKSDSGNGDSCLVNSPHTTSGLTGAGASSSASPQGNSGGGINTAALVGGIIGALALIAGIALFVFFCLIRKTDRLGRSRTKNVVEPYKSGNSYEITSTNLGSALNGSSGSRTKDDAKAKAAPGSLEARFGKGAFGRSRDANGAARNQDRELSSTQRREMYPGLSFASTQNRSAGLIDDDEDSTSGADRTAPPMPVAAAAAVPATSYQDAKRREARQAATDLARRNSDGRTSLGGTGSIHFSDEDHAGAGRRRDLSAIDEGTNSWYLSAGSDSVEQRRDQNSLGRSNTYSSSGVLLADRSDNGGNPTSANISSGSSGGRKDDSPGASRRPSTAPQNGSGRAFHLPTSAARTGDDTSPQENPRRAHDYPVDLKNEWESKDPSMAGSAHPYANAQSPHSADSYGPRGQFNDSATADTSSFTTDSVRGGGYTSPSQRGGSRGRENQGRRAHGGNNRIHPYADPLNSPRSEAMEIIRHTDAGPMGVGSDDEDDEEDGARRRRVVELPPSYGEVTAARGPSRRRRGSDE